MLSLGIAGLVRIVVRRRGWMDRPGGHKAHERPVALGGGIAVFLAFALPILAGLVAARLLVNAEPISWVPQVITHHLPGLIGKTTICLGLLGGALVLHVVGLIDDIRGLPAWVRLIVQFVVASGVVWGLGIRLTLYLPAFPAGVLSVFWLVGLINAFNLLDNMDGLSGGVGLICAGLFLWSAACAGQLFVASWLLVTMGAILGFLVYNVPPASIFMGDAGSTVVGYLLGVGSLLTTYYFANGERHFFAVFVPLVVMAIPLYDLISVVLIRVSEGRSPFRADTRHFSHRLVARGMTRRTAVFTIWLATGCTGLAATFLPGADLLGTILIFIQTIFILLIIALLEWSGGKEEK